MKEPKDGLDMLIGMAQNFNRLENARQEKRHRAKAFWWLLAVISCCTLLIILFAVK